MAYNADGSVDDFGGSQDALNLYSQINAAWQNRGNGQAAATTLDSYLNDFTQQFQNAVGRAPTADEINQFYSQAVNPVMNTAAGFSSTDPNAVVQQYIPQAYQSQIQQNQQNQTQQLGTQIGNLASQVGDQTASQLSNPSSQAYQTFAGGMNNMGADPSSGAFQSGVGQAVGSSASNTMQSLLSSLGGNAIAGNQSPTLSSLSSTGMGAQSGLSSQNQGLQNFNLEADLAKQLSAMGQPSTAQTIMGMASGGAQGAGSLMQGGADAYKATQSYVCREMVKRGLLCESDLEDFYLHMFDAVWKKGRAFWHYKVNGQKLVDAVNDRGLDWKVFKPLLFDRVMDEPDACKANELFADGCHQLCISAAPELWDERVMRTSVWDSLLFIPLLFTDATFGKNFWRILRIKTMFIYDKPRCEAHR